MHVDSVVGAPLNPRPEGSIDNTINRVLVTMTQSADHAQTRGPPPWLVFSLVAVTLFGNLYVYDSIGPIADLLQRQRGFTDTQLGMLNAIYSLPNILLILLGGILIDRFGAARIMLWTAILCFVGTALTALSPT